MRLFEWLLRRKFVVLLLSFGFENLLGLLFISVFLVPLVLAVDITLKLTASYGPLNWLDYVTISLYCFCGFILCLTFFVFAMIEYNERYVNRSKKQNNES